MDSRMRRSEAGLIQRRVLGATGAQSRKQAAAPALIQTDEPRSAGLAVRLLTRLRLRERSKSLLEQAGLRWKVARLAHGILAWLLIGFAAGWYLIPPPFNRSAFVLGPLAGALPLVYVLRKARTRLRKFEAQFPDSLEFVARSMRAGHAFSVSLEMLHHEFEEPLAGEFRRTFDEQNLGLALDLALEKLAKRIPLLDVHFFVSAVLLQKRTGGNLAELLDKLAYLIRERFKLRGRIRAISAHGRMTGTVLSLIPAGVGVIMFYVNPQYAQFFFTETTGQWMMVGAIVLQLIGYAIIKKIVSIEV